MSSNIPSNLWEISIEDRLEELNLIDNDDYSNIVEWIRSITLIQKEWLTTISIESRDEIIKIFRDKGYTLEKISEDNLFIDIIRAFLSWVADANNNISLYVTGALSSLDMLHIQIEEISRIDFQKDIEGCIRLLSNFLELNFKLDFIIVLKIERIFSRKLFNLNNENKTKLENILNDFISILKSRIKNQNDTKLFIEEAVSLILRSRK